MSAYGTMDQASPGLLYGLNHDIESKAVAEDDTFDFGDPVFVEPDVEEVAAKADDENDDLVFDGVAIISQRSTSDSQSEYPEYDEMNVLKRGMVWVTVPDHEGNTANRAVYVIHDQDDADYEKYTADSNGTFYVRCAMFKTNPNSDHMAVIELSHPCPPEAEES